MIRLLTVIWTIYLLTSCQVEVFNDSGNPQALNITSADEDSSNPSNQGGGVTNDVVLYWQTPLDRVNGDIMPFDEIGGYEIRYRTSDATEYQFIYLPPDVNQHTFTDIANVENMEFEIATYDQDGLYSDFVRAGNQ